MRIEIIAIASEVLLGMTVNTNAAFLSRNLTENGFFPVCHHVVRDNEEEIVHCITRALKNSSLVVVTGGLGPTCDDITKEILAKIFNVPLVCDQSIVKDLQKRFGKDFPTIENQAMVPKGVQLLANTIGTAPGFVFLNHKKYPDSCLIALPGVPQEMHEMFLNGALDVICKRFCKEKRVYTQSMHVFSVCEHDVDVLLRELQVQYPHIEYGIYPSLGTLTLHFQVKANDLVEAEKMFLPLKKAIQKKFSKFLYTSPTGALSEAIHLALIKKKLTVACAESCTGGLLSAEFVAYPDASKYFLGSIVAYSNDVKTNVLGVKKSLIEKYGAVSQEVVQAMSEQIRKKFGSDIGVATSGIFGPKGGTLEKPVGTVWAAISSEGFETKCFHWQLAKNREYNRDRTIKLIQIELMHALQKTKNN